MKELQLIIELLGNVSNHALIGVIVYMVLNFLKPIAIMGIVSYIFIKMFNLIKKVIEEYDENISKS